MTPGCAPPKNVAFGYDVGKISTGCLVLKSFQCFISHVTTSEIISAAEISSKLFQRHWTCWKIFASAAMSLWNNFEIILFRMLPQHYTKHIIYLLDPCPKPLWRTYPVCFFHSHLISSSPGWAFRISWSKCCLCGCLCVNQGGTNHNHCTQSTMIA